VISFGTAGRHRRRLTATVATAALPCTLAVLAAVGPAGASGIIPGPTFGAYVQTYDGSGSAHPQWVRRDGYLDTHTGRVHYVGLPSSTPTIAWGTRTYFRGDDDAMYWLDPVTGDVVDLDGILTSSPSATVSDDCCDAGGDGGLHLFAVVRGRDGDLWLNVDGYWKRSLGDDFVGDPELVGHYAAGQAGFQLDVFVERADHSMWSRHSVNHGTTWTDWQQVHGPDTRPDVTTTAVGLTHARDYVGNQFVFATLTVDSGQSGLRSCVRVTSDPFRDPRSETACHTFPSSEPWTTQAPVVIDGRVYAFVNGSVKSGVAVGFNGFTETPSGGYV
jgi:hypothetical protein